MFKFGKKKRVKEELRNETDEVSKNLIENFDEVAYLDANPDIKIAIKNKQFNNAQHHLNMFGFNEIKMGTRKFNKDFSEFNEDLYLESFSDIQDLVEKGKYLSAFDHFCKKGYQEIIQGERVWKILETNQDNNDILNKTESKKLSNKEKELLDTEFYASYYDDMYTVESKKKITKHWKEFGISEKRYPSIVHLCKDIGFNYDLSQLDIKTIVKLNPLLSTLNKNEILIKILQVKKIDLVRISDDCSFDANFYMELGKSYLIRGEKEIGHQILLYSLYLNSTSKCSELLGNYYLDNGTQKQALDLYLEALNVDSEYTSLWLYININKIYRSLNDHPSALSIVIAGLNKFQEDTHLLKILDETIKEAWDSKQEEFHALSKISKREKLIESVDKLVSELSETYREVFTQEAEVTLPSLNPKKVLIIGDYHVPQCIRYRIDQKEEQLELAGYEVSKISWTELHEKFEEIFFHDIIIYYRVPSMPVIIKSIEKARSLGKITFYEIDDLIFDAVYPPPYETYGGNISIEEYAGLTYGMPLFQATARRCEYAIGSTLPLVALLEPLVDSQKGFLHRNGLDSLNVFMSKREKEYINIFYGSGTLAHNSDFLDLTLDAIERILIKYRNVKLTIVGHLRLPESFRKQFKDQLILLDKTSTIEHYWSYLSGADINLAVLHNDIINNSKSELKWFEAACFKIPSVVSNTQNYIDVINDGEDALIAGTTEEWYEALNRLIKNKKLRDEMGENAYKKVVENYSLEALSGNIDKIIQTVLNERIIHE